MEEEGEEDDLKKRKQSDIKSKQILKSASMDKTSTSLSSADKSKVPAKALAPKKPVDSDEETASSSSEVSEESEKNCNGKSQVSPVNTSKPDKESSEASESESYEEEESADEKPSDTKVGKSVTFSPSTELLEVAGKPSEVVHDSEEEASTLSSADITEDKSSQSNQPKKEDDPIKTDDAKEGEDNFDDLGPGEVLLEWPKSSPDGTKSDASQTKEVMKKSDDTQKDIPREHLDESQKLKNEEEPEMVQQADITKVDSPVLPPRNSNGTTPATPPKPESHGISMKDIGTPIISAMKKMVEGPKKFIKSKMDSKSPTRKDKSEDPSSLKMSSSNEPPVSVAVTKDETGSPPLPPRNKPDMSTTKSKADSTITSSPLLTLKREIVTKESPKLPPRNNMETAFLSKKTDEDLEVSQISSNNNLSDDPKRFSSLQLKRNHGNGRYRESSLPPPDRLNQDGRKSPKVPPKTWMWEELRRTKVKGGYPWTYLYKGSFDEAKWKEIMEHEYEYVDPRPELLRPEPVRPQQVSVRISPSPEPEKPKLQRRFIRTADTAQVIIPLHGSSDEEHNPDRYEDPTLIGQEEIGLTPPTFHPSPSPSPSRRRESPEPKISEKLRTTAGQLGSKFKKISLPDRSKIRMPDKPKFLTDIKLPETPKFLTEKPKFLTEKPKFLTEKPKFLTEKPKFLTEKPKFLTEKPKFLTEKPKFLTERPKFLTEKPEFLKKLPDASKFKIDRSKISMPSLKLPKPRRTRSKRETSVKSEFGSEKNIFQTLKARTYPRFLNKKKRQGTKKATPPPSQTRFESESLPSTPRSKRNEKWTEVYKGKKLGDEAKVPSYSNGESFHERYSKRDAKRASSSSIVDSDREIASSGSSTQRHRAGVIEEIDSDEFFVRVKGISREDVQVSRYLSSEIREAFRSPKNALASLDKEDFADEEQLPPHRSKKPKEYPRKEYNTFPLRPSRSKRGKGAMEKPPRRFRAKGKPGSLPSLDRDRDFDMEIEQTIPVTKTPPMPPKRRKSTKDLEHDEHWSITGEIKIVPDEGMALESMKFEDDLPPVAPMRKTRSRGTSLADEDRTSRGAESIRSEMQIDDELNDELTMHLPNEVKEIVEIKQSFPLNEMPMERSGLQESPAYSNVTKSRPPRPPSPQKEAPKGKTLPHHRLKSKLMGNRHVQQLQSWKNQSVNFFFTYPRKAMKTISRAPKRPVRNYSTIAGPTRPPRRHKVFREPVYVDADIEVDNIPYIDDDEKLKSSRSEEAIGGMKGRPLPPPPRPPSPSENRALVEKKESLSIKEMNILNKQARETAKAPMSTDVPDITVGKTETSDKMQGRPLPPPPRRKRGSSSADRSRGSVSEDINEYNDFDRQEAIDARMTIDIIEPVSVVSVKQVEPIKLEDEVEEFEEVLPIRRVGQETSTRKITAEISQQTSLEVAEITVSVQTDPLPEGVIVQDTEELSTPSKPLDLDEEPTIEKYLEKYGNEIKLLGKQAAPSKPDIAPEISPHPPKPAPDRASKIELEIIENIEKEIIPSAVTLEQTKILNKPEKMEPLKTVQVENERPVRDDRIHPESGETKHISPVPSPIPITLPDRLHLSHLDVDSLNVNSLKASQILVSDLSGQSIQVAELTSRGGNLVVSGLEFPPTFIQSLASEISTKVEEKLPQKPIEVITKIVEVVQQPVEKPPETVKPESPPKPQKMTMVTAPPTVVVQPSAESVNPPTPDAGKLTGSDSIPTPRTTRNKGKKSNETRIKDDSEDELATSIKQSSKPSSLRASPVKQVAPASSQTSSQPPTDISTLTARQLLVELLNIWKNCMTEGFSACSNTIGSLFPEGQKRRDAQTAACVLFIIIIGLFALGFGTDNTVHYHHWDFMPPRM